MLKKVADRIRRHIRIRAKVSGSQSRPRLAVFRSNTSIYAQLIDDTTGKTLCSASDMKAKKWTKSEKAAAVGTDIATKALGLWIETCVFDRGGFMYMGRVKALAEAAREKWLKF